MRIDTNVADMREEPEPESRRSSQLLFNTKVEVLDQNEGWFLIQGPDSYSGWTREAYLNDFELKGDKFVIISNIAKIFNDSGKVVDRFSFGTRIAGELKGGYLVFPNSSGSRLKVERQNVKRITEDPRRDLAELARDFVGVPYLWGGTSAFGFDCSGFVQRLYGYYDVSLPRDSDQQEQECKKLGISDLGDDLFTLQLGDLLFFQGHVGIYIGSGRMIHSSRAENGVAVTDITSGDPYLQDLRNIFRDAGRPDTIPSPDSVK